MKTKYLITILLAVCSTLLVACNNQDDAHPPAEEGGKAAEVAHADDEHDDLNTTTLTTEQIKSVGIELGSIEEKQLTATLKANGELQVPNQNKAIINSIYSGIIKSILVQPGNIVRKGQTIATVANPEFIQAQSEYLNIAARISLVTLEVKRQKELNAGNAGALKNLQAAQTELKTLRTQQSTYRQQIQLMGINPSRLSGGKLISVLSVTSPINGVVSTVDVQMGSYIDVATPVAEIVDNSQLHLDLFVYEKDISKLKNDQIIHFTLTNNPGKEYDAKIYSLGSSFEGSSKAISVHAKVQGDKTGLMNGMTVTAAISLENASAAAVPTEAIVTIAGKDYIFIKSEKQGATAQDAHDEILFEKIPVAKGTSDIGYTEIILMQEIPKNAKVVVKGAFFVMAKMTNTGDHEH